MPTRDYGQLKQWCGYRAALSWGRPAPEEQAEIATSMAAYRRYMRELVDLKGAAPGDDLASDLISINDQARVTSPWTRPPRQSCSRCPSPGTRPPPG